MGRLTLRRVRALYAAWERTPATAMSMAASIGYKAKPRRGRGKKDIADFLAAFSQAGGSVKV